MVKKQLLILSISLIICPLIALAGHFTPDSVPNALSEEAVQNNPGLNVYRETIEIFKEKPAQARSYDNPRIKLSIMNLPTDTFDFDQEAMTQKQISIMQKFPFPGKLELKESAAEKDLDIVMEKYNEQKNNLIMLVKIAYMDILFLNKAIEVTEENRKLFRKFITIAETKYEVGRGIQQDVIKAQVELSKMTDRLISFEEKRNTATAHLNLLLNRPIHSPFTADGEIEHTSFNLTYENLMRLAEANSPIFSRMEHLIEKTRVSKDLSEKNYYPDMDVGVSYGQRDDSPNQERADFVSGFVTIKIPLWYKTKENRKVAEETAKIRKATEEYNAHKNNIYFQIRKTTNEIEKFNREIELFQSGLIPQSRLSLKSALSGYEVNKVDFLTLVNNQITLYNYELDYYQALTDHEIKLAELEKIIGLRLYLMFSTVDLWRK
jgi:outer membrane protein TolC